MCTRACAQWQACDLVCGVSCVLVRCVSLWYFARRVFECECSCAACERNVGVRCHLPVAWDVWRLLADGGVCGGAHSSDSASTAPSVRIDAQVPLRAVNEIRADKI